MHKSAPTTALRPSTCAELDSPAGWIEPVESGLNNYNPGEEAGIAAGAYGEFPCEFLDTTDSQVPNLRVYQPSPCQAQSLGLGGGSDSYMGHSCT